MYAHTFFFFILSVFGFKRPLVQMPFLLLLPLHLLLTLTPDTRHDSLHPGFKPSLWSWAKDIALISDAIKEDEYFFLMGLSCPVTLHLVDFLFVSPGPFSQLFFPPSSWYTLISCQNTAYFFFFFHIRAVIIFLLVFVFECKAIRPCG